MTSETTVADTSERLATVEVDVRFIRNQLTKKVDHKEFEAFKNKVVLSEKKLKSAGLI